MTRALAVELGTRNPAVRVNCIMPGPVLLPLDLPESERQQAINATLVKREGKPENIAQAVLFFVAIDFVTGVSYGRAQFVQAPRRSRIGRTRPSRMTNC